jgi:GT2 family glycosyltransferase
MHLDPRVISECVENISSKNLGALVIPEVSIGNNFWEKVKSYERSFYKDNLNFNIDSARFIKKSVFLEIGGYDESITGPEDWDLSEEIRKRGYKINKIKSVIYHTERIPNLVNHLKKFFYYGLTSYKSLKKQNQLLSTKTIPLLRRELYGDLGKIIKSPVLFTSMLIMLLLQTTAGGLGYIVGRFKRL